VDRTLNPVRQALKKFLLERSRSRFPMPSLHMLGEGDSMSRRFTSLLAPSHGDPVEHQFAHFPALSLLTASDLEALRSKFQFYDSDADPSFRTWFWRVASATSESQEKGLSLCD
jgi:hypothetical protein